MTGGYIAALICFTSSPLPQNVKNVENVENAPIGFSLKCKASLSTAFGDGGTSRDRQPVPGAAGGGGEGQAGGDGDPGGRGEAGAQAGRGHPGSPGAEVHGAEEDAGAGGKALQKQK